MFWLYLLCDGTILYSNCVGNSSIYLLPNKVKRFASKEMNAIFFFFFYFFRLEGNLQCFFSEVIIPPWFVNLNLTEFVTFCGPFPSLYLLVCFYDPQFNFLSIYRFNNF